MHMFALRSKDKSEGDEERLANLLEKEREAQEKVEKEMPS